MIILVLILRTVTHTEEKDFKEVIEIFWVRYSKLVYCTPEFLIARTLQ